MITGDFVISFLDEPGTKAELQGLIKEQLYELLRDEATHHMAADATKQTLQRTFWFNRKPPLQDESGSSNDPAAEPIVVVKDEGEAVRVLAHLFRRPCGSFWRGFSGHFGPTFD